MKDLRFTGHIAGDYIDVRFRTDMIKSDAENFNVSQIQIGPDFASNDKLGDNYQKHFGATFGEKNTSMTACKSFAIDKGLNLRLYNEDGSVESLVHDHSDSTSDNN